eukprot:Skav217402  [mRNA]  locus=scaffold532:778750:787366:+ [translate_table: standard]
MAVWNSFSMNSPLSARAWQTSRALFTRTMTSGFQSSLNLTSSKFTASASLDFLGGSAGVGGASLWKAKASSKVLGKPLMIQPR